MDLFYRDYDTRAPITSGAQHLSAAAARFAVSIVRSIPHLPESVWREVERLITVDTVWSLCLILAGWVIATLVGGLLGLAVNAILVIYGLIELWEQIKETVGITRSWLIAAYEADTDAQLDAAAQHFAAALSKGGITFLEVLVTHRVFRAVEGKLRTRFPTPDWLSKQYKDAVEQRAPKSEASKTEASLEKTRRAAARLVDVTTSGVRYEGAKGAADDFPTIAVALGSVLVVAGTLAVAAWAAQANTHKVRP